VTHLRPTRGSVSGQRAVISDTVEQSRQRTRAALERIIESLQLVIDENEKLRTIPGHEESARQRLSEAADELSRAREELARLDGGAWPGTGRADEER
jgi:chromosome segregation ATPase